MDHSQPASMQDVAKAASVSPQTVSRVANGSNAVRPETRQRVEAAMAKLGYRPNYAARALKHGKFKDVGVVLFNMLTYGNARILGGNEVGAFKRLAQIRRNAYIVFQRHQTIGARPAKLLDVP